VEEWIRAIRATGEGGEEGTAGSLALYAFDGTWNVRDRKLALDHVQEPQYGVDQAARRDTVETNVHRFREYYGVERSEYLQGVGTRFGAIGRALGGAFGLGARHRIRSMYRRLTERYFDQESPDRDIDLLGFSRGAALAVHFANLLFTHGLRNPSNPRHWAFKYYPELGWTFRHPKRGKDDVDRPQIRFLGLWDCVATFGWPIWPFRNRSRKWKVWELPANVQHSFHAMALDEVRPTFSLVRPRADPKRECPHYEVWFRGVHSNIGGGYVDRGLSDIALAWMMEQAVWTWRKVGWKRIPSEFTTALRCLEPGCERPPEWVGTNLETLEPDPNGSIGRPFSLRRQAWRKLPEDPLIHHSVLLRAENLISDHYLGNRPLTRWIPRSSQAVQDPPMFYDGTLVQSATALADECFARVPVRPREWITLDGRHVFRSDDWIADGTTAGRDGPTEIEVSKQAFVQVARDWLLAGRPDDADDFELSGPLLSRARGAIRDPSEVERVKHWVLHVLSALEPHLPWRSELADIASLRARARGSGAPRSSAPGRSGPITREESLSPR